MNIWSIVIGLIVFLVAALVFTYALFKNIPDEPKNDDDELWK